MKQIILYTIIASLAISGCSKEDDRDDVANDGSTFIEFRTAIDDLTSSRVTDNKFTEKDQIGIYVTDYTKDTPSTLLDKKNHADNVAYVLNDKGVWSCVVDSCKIYWNNRTTKVDFFAYYPYTTSVANVKQLTANVQTDQSNTSKSTISGQTRTAYEASDLLLGALKKTTPQKDAVTIPFSHVMSQIIINVKFSDKFITAGEKEIQKIFISGTLTKATADIATQMVTPVANSVQDITPLKLATANTGYTASYMAILVPQTVAKDTRLFQMTIGGVSYVCPVDDAVIFASGKSRAINLTVNKSEILVSVGSIKAWENNPLPDDDIKLDIPEVAQ